MNIFIEIGLIVFIATAISILMRLLKQPLFVGYILSGVVLGPYFLNFIQSTEYIELFSKIGIAILLFIVGLSLKPDIIRQVGKVSLIVGIGQIIITSILGFVVMKCLGFSDISSVYGAIAITLSSTIIILKLLSDRGDTDKLYGKISIGLLLVQDVFATIILLAVAIFGSSSLLSGNITQFAFLLALKGILFFVILYFVSRYLLPKLMNFLATSQELLFLFSITWGLGLAAVFYKFGFSLEIGALAAGVALSASPFSQEISSRMKPLRDFFILLFFIMLGSQIVIFDVGKMIIPALILSAFIFILKPIIVFVLMRILNYKVRTGFFTALTVSQVSEFSLILLALGLSFGHLSGELVSLITLTGVITIAGSAYLVLHADVIYKYLRPVLVFLELRKKLIEEKEKEDITKDTMVVFGYDRVGYDFVNIAKKLNKDYFVVDFNPNLIPKFKKNNIPFRFGDAEDIDFLEDIGIIKAGMIVSTIPDFKTNLNLVSYYRSHNIDGIIIVVSHTIKNTQELYEKGASFVVMSHYLGAMHASKMIEAHSMAPDTFEKEKKHHIEYLEQRQKLTE
ncbi:MAG: cation:proton antiporter [Candidatus Paceibacterota bacterium]|jgi:Kef-type K+ transport system membrane component KefB